ncbi:hypothetical protein PATSB16_03920 [Pandoraea thiooxydans]|nr:hypothetical protein PATSB16_03920 [Pandoraea thiooxydans]
MFLIAYGNDRKNSYRATGYFVMDIAMTARDRRRKAFEPAARDDVAAELIQ